MFRKIENPFNKPEVTKNSSLYWYSAAIQNLIDGLSDKDDHVKGVCEASLIRIANRHPNEIVNYAIGYKKKSSKIPDTIVAVILRYIIKIKFDKGIVIKFHASLSLIELLSTLSPRIFESSKMKSF